MKKMFLVLMFVIGWTTEGLSQSPASSPIPYYSTYYLYKNYLGVDSAFLLPQRDTSWLPARPALVYQPSDSSLYYWNWNKWNKIGGIRSEADLGLYLLKTSFIDSLNANRQQLIKVGDSVYLSFGGVVNVAPDSSVYVTRYYLSNQGYITSESDPVFTSSPAYNITTTNINDWQSAFKTAVYNPSTDTLTLTSVNGAPTKIFMVAIANTDTVETVSKLKAYSGGAYILVLADTSDGGLFYKSDDDLTANDSTIFNAQGGGYWVKITNSASGSVTSVGLSLPTSLFTISNSPVTSTGTLTGTFKSQSANFFFASPYATSGVPDFRTIGVNDLPNIPTTKITGLATVATSGSYNDLSDRPATSTLSNVTHAGNSTDSSIYIRKGSDSIHLGNNGDIVISGKIVAAEGGFNSDRRLKNILNIRPIHVIKKLHPVMYRWKPGKGDTVLHIGYVAQEVERFMPNAVIQRPDGYKALNYTAIHTAAINDLYGIIKKQQKEIDALKKEINKLKDKL